MFNRIHQKLGTAGFIISIVALVAALGGGAYAASGGLNGKQKKEVEKIAKHYAGKPGKNGQNGANGAPGAKGEKGDAGANGAAGAAGLIGPQGPQGPQGVQGPQGSPWTAGGTLPSGKTETGTFAYATSGGQITHGKMLTVPISFSIPLANPLGEGQVHLISADGTKEIVEEEATETYEEIDPTGCGTALTPAGTAANPAAAPGNLCVYVSRSDPGLLGHSGSNYIRDPSLPCEAYECLAELGGPGSGAGVSGARLEVFGSAEGYVGYGTWAVTAP